MAADDITVVITTGVTAGSGTFDRQPSGGVVEMLIDIGAYNIEGSAPNGTPAVQVNISDGTNVDAKILDGDDGNSATVWFRGKHCATNTNYFTFLHQGANNSDISCTYIEVG
jgi:hypothetical protein